MKTILHATDYSENAISALKYAYDLSVKTTSKLWIIHVFDLSTLSSDINETYLIPFKESLLQKNEALKNFCSTHLGSDYNSINIQTEAFENSSVVKGIIEKSDEVFASLIIVGMKGKSALKDLILGSTTKKIINKSPCPVLAIPTNITSARIKNVVYTTDYEEEDISALFRLTDLFKNFNPSIKIVHISSKNNIESEEEMEWFTALLKQKVTYDKLEFKLLYSDIIYTTLQLYLDEIDADIIAMLERSKKGFSKKIFHKDLVKKMEASINIPLISFNEKNY